MFFLENLLKYGLQYIILIAVSLGGVFVGKKLRDRKDAKKS